MENQSAKESVTKFVKKSRNSDEFVAANVAQPSKSNAVLCTGNVSVNTTHTVTINHTVSYFL